MSYSNGYTNGSNRYGDVSHADERRSGSRQRRTGGYGAFHDSSLPVPSAYELEPPPEQPSFRRRENDESIGGFGLFAYGRRDTDDHDSSRSRDRGRRTHDTALFGNGPGGKQIESVLDHIRTDWDAVTIDDCVPVHIALQLMDYSSLGRGNDYQDFQKTNKHLQRALKSIVNEHHQGFNSSIGTFHKIQASIQTSQNRVRALRGSMQGAKSNLMMTKPGLRGLGSSSQKYDEMLLILNQIEKLQMVPEQLDARISDKHFLQAVDLLQDALRIIRRSDMESLGALTDLRIYFANQETSLTDILIEELHDHLYLKSPYCQDRWRPYNGDLIPNASSPEYASTRVPKTWGRPLILFLDTLDTSLPMENDASRNPESNNFQYMYMVIESLTKLGQLNLAIDRVEQRLPIELFAVVDRTNKEVDMRHAAHIRYPRDAGTGWAEIGFEGKNGDSEVLKDLLWTLYSKFEAIAESHRVVHDVVAGIVKREGVGHPEKLLGGFREMWKLYQSEIRSLLHGYLATGETQLGRPSRQHAADGNIFHRSQRDRDKRVFKLSYVDGRSADMAADHQDLDQILQASVPGLVSKSERRLDTGQNKVLTASDGPVAGHKLLIEPNVFNISSLLPPSLTFLQRLRDIVPYDSNIATSTLTTFLDEFLINVFYPQLEETVADTCARTCAELDAFQEDSQWSQYSKRPILKGTLNFLSLIRCFCQLLDTIPPDVSSTQLIITQVVAYYDKCYDWYKTLVKRPQMQVEEEVRYLKTAAVMVEEEDIRNIVLSIWTSSSPEQQAEFFTREVQALIAKTNETHLEPFDIISDRRSVKALCLIYCSMHWLVTQLIQLRRVMPKEDSSHHESSRPRHARKWSQLDPHATEEGTSTYLPMTQETVEAFDRVLASIHALGDTALMTLHVDIRLGVIHMLSRTLRGTYILAQPAQDPDPSILSLNADLVSFADELSTYLPPLARNFVKDGLSFLIDTFLVSSAVHISQGMNENGCRRMQLNILVLSQNLKTIETSSADRSIELERSARFFDLFMEGADSVVEKAKDRGGEGLDGFSLEELKGLLELWYRDGTESTAREVQVKSRRELGDRLLILSECLWNR